MASLRCKGKVGQKQTPRPLVRGKVGRVTATATATAVCWVEEEENKKNAPCKEFNHNLPPDLTLPPCELMMLSIYTLLARGEQRNGGCIER